MDKELRSTVRKELTAFTKDLANDRTAIDVALSNHVFRSAASMSMSYADAIGTASRHTSVGTGGACAFAAVLWLA